MAITYITGKPGTGKSYYSAYKLWKHFIYVPKQSLIDKLLNKEVKSIKHDFKNSYTNLNEFSFKSSKKILPLDFNELYLKIKTLHDLYKLKEPDSVINKKAKQLNIYKSLFVIDEVQDYFTKKDEVLVWWFTYHRHMFHEIILMTQDVSLVPKEYFVTAEHFYMSVPSEKRVSNKSFRYIKNSSPKFYAKDKLGDFTVPRIDDVFKLYVSGDNNDGKSLVKKFIFIAIAFVFVLLIAFSWFISSFSNDEEINNTPAPVQKTEPKEKQKEKKEVISSDNNLRSFTFYCFKNYCTYQNYTFPKKFIINTIKKLNPNEFDLSKYGTSEKYFILAPADTFKFLNIKKPKKEKKENEKNTKSILPSSLPLF